MTKLDRIEILRKIKSGKALWRTQYKILIEKAESATRRRADPFSMEDIRQIEFGWCGGKKDGVDDTLSELSAKLDEQSGSMRDLALAFSLSGKVKYADAAETYLLQWIEFGTLFNLYDLNIDFKEGRFDNMTKDGYCGLRPWNMALDGMWQTYGLINVSDSYLLLKSGGYEFGDGVEDRIQEWIRSLAEAVNSSFHAWTRWADYHKGSRAFLRYRSDNHLSWCLAGLMAAAVVLEDERLEDYVLKGGSWKDRKAGEYRNPSSIRNLIDLAIESDPGGEKNGRIYEEKIGRKPPMGYALFHLWPMSLVATMAEKHSDSDIWHFKGEDGASLKDAFERYAAYVIGDSNSPKPEQEGARNNYAWLFEIAVSVWPEQESILAARDSGRRDKYTRQSIGPVSLIYGRE